MCTDGHLSQGSIWVNFGLHAAPDGKIFEYRSPHGGRPLQKFETGTISAGQSLEFIAKASGEDSFLLLTLASSDTLRTSVQRIEFHIYGSAT